jgi:hypothetical protein
MDMLTLVLLLLQHMASLQSRPNFTVLLLGQPHLHLPCSLPISQIDSSIDISFKLYQSWFVFLDLLFSYRYLLQTRNIDTFFTLLSSWSQWELIPLCL